MNAEDRKFEETMALLREAHREPIAEAHFAAVRARVLSKIEAEHRVRWRGWAVGLAAALVSAILLLAYWPRAAERPAMYAAVKEAALSREQPLPRKRSIQRPLRRRKTACATCGPTTYRFTGPPVSRPLVVKLITDDPNVVIYWISGE